MTLKKFSRAGLLALAGAIALAILLSVPSFHASYAQTPAAPAATAAAPAAAAAEAPPPACDAKILTNCSPNSGDTAWMLTSMAIVLMMTIPGLALFYGGLVRKKNVGDTVMTTFAITCLISILWLFFTYSLAFRAGTPFIGGLDRAFLQGIVSDITKNIGNPNPLAPTIPETVYSMFQLTFAIITAALIAGSFAERMKFSAMLWFIGLWAIFVYSPIAHWVWGPDGIFNSANPDARVHVLDFAGGTVVHVNSGTAGLMAALMLGKRKDTAPPHNMVLTMIGASLLWVGWFGFNAGSALNAGALATSAFAATHFSAAAAALSWTCAEWYLKGKPSVLGAASGMVAGLATITPASGFVSVPAAFAIGLVAGVVCYLAVTKLKSALGYDDSLDVFGVHGIGSTTGMLMLGFLASSTVNPLIATTFQKNGVAVSLAGGTHQFWNQLAGVGATVALAAIATFIILKLVDAAVGLRVDQEDESLGLDLSQHGERAYNE
jgi:ammonium transporter, Amt family